LSRSFRALIAAISAGSEMRRPFPELGMAEE
jgi:hypothetical protein